MPFPALQLVAVSLGVCVYSSICFIFSISPSRFTARSMYVSRRFASLAVKEWENHYVSANGYWQWSDFSSREKSTRWWWVMALPINGVNAWNGLRYKVWKLWPFDAFAMDKSTPKHQMWNRGEYLNFSRFLLLLPSLLLLTGFIDTRHRTGTKWKWLESDADVINRVRYCFYHKWNDSERVSQK